VFFTGIGTADHSAHVFSVTPPATTVGVVNTDTNLVLPVGIATPTDPADTNVFVADLVGSGAATPSATSDLGAIFIVSQSGGTAQAIANTAGYQPRSLTLSGGPDGGDVLYFSGVDPTTGYANVFTMAPNSSGTPVAVIDEQDVNDPSGIAIDGAGDIFVVDTDSQSGTGLSSIVEISNGESFGFTVVDSLKVGYPAGLAFGTNGTTLYVSGRSTIDGSDVIISIDTTQITPFPTTTSAPGGIGNYLEPAGLHADLSSPGTIDFVDSLAGSSGAVFRVTP
jgi:hypothetical protein